MPDPLLPPYPANQNAHVEIFGPDADGGRWDESAWDDATWAGVGWKDVTPESMFCEVAWGADDPSGVLTVTAAGSWTVKTYDPERKLDPSNGASIYAQSLRPGRPFRLSHVDANGIMTVIRQGLIDEVSYDLVNKTGALTGTDAVSLMAAAKMLPGQNLDPAMPNTLRARAHYLVAKAGMDKLVTVEPVLEYDPPVSAIEDKEAALWALIQTAAYDALYTAWIDKYGMLRFRSFGDPRDNGLSIGGVDGLGVGTIEVNAGLANVYTRIIAYDESAPEVEVIRASEIQSVIYGDITLRRKNPVPDAATWAEAVLADRSGAALQYEPGTIYPQTAEQLIELVDMQQIDILHIVAESIEPSIDVSARILGAKITVDTGTGWTFKISSYIPASEWSEDITPPEPPIEPNPPPTKTVTRLYYCTKDTRAARTSGNQNYGAGKEGEIPIGAWQGWRNRGIFDFDQISFADVVEVEKCELLLNTTTQVNVGFGGSPKVIIKRITENWSEGNATNPSYDNDTIYPGPSVTNASSVTRTLPSREQEPVALAMTDICRSWFKGSAQYGVALYSAGEDNSKYTTEVWDRSHSNVDARPKLRLTLKVLV